MGRTLERPASPSSASVSMRSSVRSPSPAARFLRIPPTKPSGLEDAQVIGFDSLALKDLLEADSRPAFVVDVAAASQNDSPLSRQVYINGTMKQSQAQRSLISLDQDPTTAGEEVQKFWAWAVNRANADWGTDFESYSFAGMRWIRVTLRSRWRTISGCDSLRLEGEVDENGHLQEEDVEPLRKTATNIYGATGTVAPSSTARTLSIPLHKSPVSGASSPRPSGLSVEPSVQGSSGSAPLHDWTAAEPPPTLSPHMKLARSIDWSKTSLGPMESWSDGFRLVCNFLMSDPRPATVIWGPDRNVLYNAPYIEIVGHRHPAGLGLPFHELFPEVAGFQDFCHMVEKSGIGFTKEDSEFHLKKHGDYLEETFFSFTLTPIWEQGKVAGLYNPVFETTRRQIAERRMATLIKIGESTAANRDISQFWEQAVHALQLNEHDFPFASVYSVSSHEDSSDDASSESSFNSVSSFKKLHLEGAIGIPEGHPAATVDLDLSHGQEDFLPYFRAAARSADVVTLHIHDGTLTEALLQDIRCRPFGDPCRSIVILPIKPTQGNSDNVGGFILLGLNPRRPYDEDYHVFFQLLSRLLGASLAAALLLEEEICRSRTAAKQAASDQAKLEEELARKAQEAKRLEMQFTHFAERAPIGINMFSAEGKILYANDMWYDVTMYDESNAGPMSWMDCFVMEEKSEIEAIWNKLLVGKQSVTFECQLKKKFTTPGAPNFNDAREKDIPGDYTWVMASAYPELNPVDGSVDLIIGCFMDISQNKWAALLQRRRMEEAIEAKKLQEKFIDMTSHEMRNPLSAIIHCCDGIISALSVFDKSPGGTYELSHDVISNNLEAARTILHCSIHQKRIVDDILTLSKLDSDLLPVSPVNVDILQTVKEALSIFNAEVKSADIELRLDVDESFKTLELAWVFVDPSRLTQVFINLLTNAIKFTQTEDRRVIRVRLGASLQRPETGDSDVKYVESKQRSDVTAGADWGEDQIVYLHFAVQDTGRGLNESERDHLFRRFSQASPRTHVQYGGSGLGLFIARELTEKLGGEIGVASESGKGSTFAFYVKSRRAPAPTKGSRKLSRTDSSFESEIAIGLERRLSVSSPAPSLSTAAVATATNGIASAKQKNRTPLTPATRFPVLIVEDNLVNRKVLQKQLSNLGFPIHEANHGLEALAFLRTTKFWRGREADGEDLAVILMDVEMPVMDGLTCMRKVRELEREGMVVKHIPTIAVTANARKEQIDTALEAGMDNVVCKPFRIPELVTRMEELEGEMRRQGAL